jgi:hypothetical protein
MMLAIVVGAVFAHVAVALMAARMAYGRARIWILTKREASYSFQWSNQAWCVIAGYSLTVGCLVGLWPLMLAAMFVMAKPPKTPAELQDQMKAQQRHIADLERELGISERKRS